MSIIILTGNQSRHKYFANTIAEKFEVSAIFSEGKVFNPAGESVEDKSLTDEEKALWKWHFGLAKDEEEKAFGMHTDFKCKNIFEVPKGHINSEEWRQKIQSFSPRIIVVYGTSLLKDETISILPEGIINMHLGLSPYYRGSGTNFWPLYNNEPQYVGVTIHRIDRGIDTGPIIHQGRPHIEKGDNQHTIGNKTIQAGTKLMIQTITEVLENRAQFHPQTNKGKLYSRKDFSVANIPKLKQLMESGMLDTYADNPVNVDIIK